MQARRLWYATAAAGIAVLGTTPIASATPVPAPGPGTIVTVYEGTEHGDVRVVRLPLGGVRTGLGGSVRTGDPWQVAAGLVLLAGAASGMGLAIRHRRASRTA
jgi:hypothetical protein